MRQRVVIADDHPVVAWATCQLLVNQTCDLFEVVARVHSTDELHRQMLRHPCDLLITDFCMPHGQQPDGLALIGYLRRHYPATNIMVMTMMTSPATLRALYKLGVRGLFDKHGEQQELVQAARSVARGGRYLSASFDRLLQADTRSTELEQTALSPRELEVMRLFGQGLSGREIARKLNRSEKTISRHKRTALEKLGPVQRSTLIEFL